MKTTIEIVRETLMFIFGMIFLFAFLTFVVLVNLEQVSPILYYVFGVAIGAFLSFLITSYCIHWRDNFEEGDKK